jgi:hypothetical protein
VPAVQHHPTPCCAHFPYFACAGALAANRDGRGLYDTCDASDDAEALVAGSAAVEGRDPPAGRDHYSSRPPEAGDSRWLAQFADGVSPARPSHLGRAGISGVIETAIFHMKWRPLGHLISPIVVLTAVRGLGCPRGGRSRRSVWWPWAAAGGWGWSAASGRSCMKRATR